MSTNATRSNGYDSPAQHPFRKAVLRGLGVVAPPLLTILIFIWVIDTTNEYVLRPVTDWTRWVIVELRDDVKMEEEISHGEPAKDKEEITDGEPPKDEEEITDGEPSKDEEEISDGKLPKDKEGNEYIKVGVRRYVKKDVYERVEKAYGDDIADMSAREISGKYVDLEHLQWWRRVPFFLALFILALYLLGRFMAAGIGRFFWNRFERGIHRLPVIRNVYSSVKQVSDFLFSEREIEYTRVVAVQYPRRGIWSLGFVTGDSMLDIQSAANEPVMSVLMPTSPMPVTGFTITVPKSECLDLNITIDQAFQFIVSCGVVVPPQQMQEIRAAPEALPGPAEEGDSVEPAGDDE